MQRHAANIRIDHSSTNNLEGAACLGMMFRHVLGYLNSSMFLQGRVHQKFEGVLSLLPNGCVSEVSQAGVIALAMLRSNIDCVSLL